MSSNVVTITWTPPERDDRIPWVTALIQEAAVPAGPWTTVETVGLAPYDTDPANPVMRELTTDHATLEQGWYRVIWVDGTPTQSTPSAPVQNTSELAGGVRPSVQEVATYIKARTKITGGRTLGTFTKDTPVTDDEVEDFIDDALGEVLGKVQPIDTTQAYGSAFNAPGSDYERRIRKTVALYAAISIELSLFPEQVRNNQSPAAMMQQRYESRIRALIAEGESGRAQGEGSGPGGGGDAPADAAWSMPDAAPGALIGWASRW